MSRHPQGLSECLQHVAGYLDLADQLIEQYARAQGVEDLQMGDDVQADLRELADWIAQRPQLDQQLFEAVPALAGWVVPDDLDAWGEQGPPASTRP